MKHTLAQNVYAQLYSTFLSSSIIITQLLSLCLKTELHLLPVSEMGTFHTLALNFWGITVTRYFRPKSGHSNERVNRKAIDGRLKTLRNEVSGSFLRLIKPELWSFSKTSSAVFWIKRKYWYKILKKFLSKKMFPQSPKSTKKYNFKYNSSK